MERDRGWPPAWKALFCASALLFAAFYWWSAQAANPPFEWHYDKIGAYNLLTRGFVQGQLSVPIPPSAELLALPDPWDPERNAPYAWQDFVLYNRRYYVYHGVTPAILLFLPWRLIARRDLPESFAVLLFCMLGYLFSAATLLRLLAAMGARPPAWLLGLLLVVLGVCQTAPFLLERASVYEVAISAGYFCLSAGFWALVRVATASGGATGSAVFAGLMFGLTVGCRPNLVFPGLAAWLVLLWFLIKRRPHARQALVAFTIPLAACGFMIAAYNYARFHNALEFGMHYEMAAANYRDPHPALENLTPGLFYLLLSPPIFEPVFPFVRLAVHLPFAEIPKRYFLEPIDGAITIFPLLLIAFAAPRLRQAAPVRPVLVAMLLAAIACVVFIASLGLVSHRFEMDYEPSFLLLACLVLGGVRLPLPALAIAVLALAYSIGVNLAIGIEGPYGGFVTQHPASYVNLARRFSAVKRLRPMLNPRLDVEASFQFPDFTVPGPVPLIDAGRYGSRYAVSAKMLGGNRVLLHSVSQGLLSEMKAEVALLPHAANKINVQYDPANRVMTIRWNGDEALRHPVAWLVTAPAQVTCGDNHSELNAWKSYFPGKVQVLKKQVNGLEYR